MERLLEYINRHPFLTALAVAMALAVLTFELRARRLGHSAIGSQEAVQLMNQGAKVFDVRDAASFAAGHINGAKHLDPADHDAAAEQLKKYKDKVVLLYCDQGVRSTGVLRRLQAAGFTKVFHLRGGLAAWRADGLPLARG